MYFQSPVQDLFVGYCQENVDFLDKSLESETVIIAIHSVTSQFPKNFSRALRPREFTVTFLELLKMCVPPCKVAVEANRITAPWLIKTNTAPWLQRLVTPMADSKVYRDQPQIAPPKAKKAKKGEAPEPPPPEEDFPLTVELTNCDTTRDVQFLDDVWCMIRYAIAVVEFKGHGAHLAERPRDRVIAKVVSSSLEFAINGRILVSRKKVEAWSKVRAVLRDMIIAAHEAGAVAAMALTGDPTADMMANLMASTAAADDATAASAEATKRPGIAAFLENDELQTSLVTFIKETPLHRPAPLHPALIAIQQE
eukprot:2617716-Pyramimonas_sp.AAC.1